MSLETSTRRASFPESIKSLIRKQSFLGLRESPDGFWLPPGKSCRALTAP